MSTWIDYAKEKPKEGQLIAYRTGHEQVYVGRYQSCWTCTTHWYPLPEPTESKFEKLLLSLAKEQGGVVSVLPSGAAVSLREDSDSYQIAKFFHKAGQLAGPDNKQERTVEEFIDILSRPTAHSEEVYINGRLWSSNSIREIFNAFKAFQES